MAAAGITDFAGAGVAYMVGLPAGAFLTVGYDDGLNARVTLVNLTGATLNMASATVKINLFV
jgi:hypothetical protein